MKKYIVLSIIFVNSMSMASESPLEAPKPIGAHVETLLRRVEKLERLAQSLVPASERKAFNSYIRKHPDIVRSAYQNAFQRVEKLEQLGDKENNGTTRLREAKEHLKDVVDMARIMGVYKLK